MKALAPKKNGDTNNIKALLAQLNQASVSTIDEYQATGDGQIDDEVPMNAIDELRDMTGMLLKMDAAPAGAVQKPTAGKSFNKRMSAMTGEDMLEVPDTDTEKNREDTLRETM